MMPMARAVIISLLAALAVAGLARAHETDQFTLPPDREFADLSDELTAWAYGAIRRGVDKANRRIEQAVRSGASADRLAELQSPDEIVRAVNSEFPWAMDVIEGWERKLHSKALRQRFPGKVVGYKETLTNIYQGAHLPIDPRQFFRLYLGSTFRLGDVYLGTDKIGHFTDMGMNYWRAYRAALRAGKTEQEAMRQAVDSGSHGLIFSERGMLGYLTAGAYSNGDMAANYLGLVFYRNLTEPMMLRGQTSPPMVVRQGPGWKLAEHVRPDTDFFVRFFSEHHNELLNPSHYEGRMRPTIRKAVRQRAPDLLNRYCDEHGLRRSPGYFEEKVRELSTYWGQDYGHNGPMSDLIIAARMLMEPASSLGPEARDRAGRTALHAAAEEGDTARVRHLLQAGADANDRIRSDEPYSVAWGQTPLHLAARAGRSEAIRILLEHAADAGLADDRGVTPLHCAAGSAEACRLLVAAGARVDAEELQGQTPLHWAARDRAGGGIDVLLKLQPATDAVDHEGRTPLHLAALAGNANAAEALLAAGANVNAKDRFGVTPLHLACTGCQKRLAEVLLAAGADLWAADDFGYTPLHEAARSGNEQIAAVLVGAWAAIEARDAHGNTALHLACRGGRRGVVAVLLEAGADVNSCNRVGSTPLHEAAFRGDVQLVKTLLDRGAVASAKDHFGRTPQELAGSRGHREVRQLLKGVPR